MRATNNQPMRLCVWHGVRTHVLASRAWARRLVSMFCSLVCVCDLISCNWFVIVLSIGDYWGTNSRIMITGRHGSSVSKHFDTTCCWHISLMRLIHERESHAPVSVPSSQHLNELLGACNRNLSLHKGRSTHLTNMQHSRNLYFFSRGRTTTKSFNKGRIKRTPSCNIFPFSLYLRFLQPLSQPPVLFSLSRSSVGFF